MLQQKIERISCYGSLSVHSRMDLLQSLSSDLNGVDLSLLERDLEVLRSDDCSQIAGLCGDRDILHSDWSMLAGRVMVHKIKGKAPPSFSAATDEMNRWKLLEPKYHAFVMANAAALDAMVVPDRDYSFNRFAMGTLMQSYLIKVRAAALTDNVKKGDETWWIETPQYMYMRVATFMWYPDMVRINSAYRHMSKGDYTQASPTLFNAGRVRHQLSSCFLLSTEDTMISIEDSWIAAAEISRNSGGVGLSYSSLRHSEIAHQGKSGGIVRWARIMNDILVAVDQGGLRKGSGTMYIEPWHIDIAVFLDLRKATGPEDMRARDLFYALWVPDLFMRRVEADSHWTLFCPNKTLAEVGVDLTKLWGEEFDEAYERCERVNPSYSKRVRARQLWESIILAQIETGMPFILYKDACNRKSNQKNLGVIKCSNLCTEIVQFSSDEEISSCNLASVALPSCVVDGAFSFSKLRALIAELVCNLNEIIERNYYPPRVPAIHNSNLRNRPIGIGIQGLADVFALLDLTWDSQEARDLNRDIAESMYYAAVEQSVNLAELFGPYDTFAGSPASEGLFQFDLWDMEDEQKRTGRWPKTVEECSSRTPLNPDYDWEALRKRMMTFGLRNSLLIANMPTASSANILGNNEAFEPFTSNIFARTVLSGQYVIINRHLLRDLEGIGMWNTETVLNMITNDGSVQNIPLPGDDRDARVEHLKRKYRTVFELSQRVLMDMNLDRSRFVCQSQSFNCWMRGPTYTKLNAYHFYGWKRGAKTGMYYLRQMAGVDPINFATDGFRIPTKKVCMRRGEDEMCVSCQS